MTSWNTAELGERDKHSQHDFARPVGWSGDGGVRESNKVELIKSGGGGVAPLAQRGGMGERCKLPHRGLGRSPSRFATFAIFQPQNIA